MCVRVRVCLYLYNAMKEMITYLYYAVFDYYRLVEGYLCLILMFKIREYLTIKSIIKCTLFAPLFLFFHAHSVLYKSALFCRIPFLVVYLILTHFVMASISFFF